MTDEQPPHEFATLEILTHDNGQLLFPATLKKRDERGNVVEKKVRIRVPNPGDLSKAYLRAVEFFAKNKKLNRKDDARFFDETEQLEILAISIRTWEDPHPQFQDREELVEWDDASLQDIQERINVFKLLVDPRIQVLDDEQFFRTALAIDKGQTMLPLGDMAGPAQLSFIMRSVSLALSSPTALSWLQPLETSTPAS